ncbi:MAG: hypothetical protein JOZ02_13480 [Acidobacteria bacterium]|nr:hypothetical protein [Acidobacteriota bacterium]
MLKPKDASAIRRLGFATLHDYWLTSLSAGEPFYEEGALAYFDGRMVTLSGFPLRDSAPLSKESLRALAERWAVERGAEALLFLGPRPDKKLLGRGSGLRLVYEGHRPAISAELFIDCADPEFEGRARRLCRAARATGLRLGSRAGGVASAQHFGLVERFYGLRPLTSFLADVSFIIPAVLRSRRVDIIEAWAGRRLAGFILMHQPFEDTAVGVFLFHDHVTAGVSDLLYQGMVAQARRRGARYVNVGASPTRGHYGFKLKWGAVPLVPPYHCSVWARGHLGRRKYISWGPRLLGL